MLLLTLALGSVTLVSALAFNFTLEPEREKRRRGSGSPCDTGGDSPCPAVLVAAGWEPSGFQDGSPVVARAARPHERGV